MLLMVVEEIEIWLRLVVRSFSLVRIWVKILKVVSESVIFMKMMNGVMLLLLEVEEIFGKVKEVMMFIVKGRSILVVVMEIVFLLVCWRDFRLILRLMRKRKRSRLRFVSVLSIVRFFVGNNEFLYVVILLRVDGLRSILFWVINLCLYFKLLLNWMFLNWFRLFSWEFMVVIIISKVWFVFVYNWFFKM